MNDLLESHFGFQKEAQKLATLLQLMDSRIRIARCCDIIFLATKRYAEDALIANHIEQWNRVLENWVRQQHEMPFPVLQSAHDKIISHHSLLDYSQEFAANYSTELSTLATTGNAVAIRIPSIANPVFVLEPHRQDLMQFIESCSGLWSCVEVISICRSQADPMPNIDAELAFNSSRITFCRLVISRIEAIE